MLKPAVVLLGLVVASPALADDALFFRSPSGNINCVLGTGDDAYVRCDIAEFTPSFSRPPAECDLDWGDSFEITVTGRKGALGCHGDTAFSEESFTLGYDDVLIFGGFACTSERTGMSCINERGHGFEISKTKQRVF